MNKQKLIKKHISLDINKQIKAVIKEFDEKFAFSLHEMVDGDYCPALGVKLPSMYYREKTSAVGGNEPNFTITSNKGECQCGGQEKIDDIKAFLKSKLQEVYEAGRRDERNEMEKTIAFRHLKIAEENLKIYRGMEDMAMKQSKTFEDIKNLLKTYVLEQNIRF